MDTAYVVMVSTEKNLYQSIKQ